jgi:hypothetical protein
MSGDFLKDTLQTIIFLLPVLALVWKGAKMSSKIEQLELTVKEKTDKFCKDHSDMQKRIEQERSNNEKSMDAVMLTLNEIQKSIVRIETKLDMEESKK